MTSIDQNRTGIALVVNEDRQLVATVTDGDIRRAVLSGTGLDEPVNQLFSLKQQSPYPEPVTAQIDDSHHKLLTLMRERNVRQIPLLDEQGRPVDLVIMDELVPASELPLQAVVMAGGFGTRLAPLTKTVPKPMLPVGDRPMLHHIIDQLRTTGITEVHVATHFKPEVIEQYFGDGEEFGVHIRYVEEDKPLGTAGALGLIASPTTPLLVVNGDVLTNVNYQAMLNFHHEHDADLTVASRKYEMKVPFGILECDGPLVLRVREKPIQSSFVSAGIYLLNPSVHAQVAQGERLDMPDLITRLIESGQRVATFPVLEYWLDVGRHPEYLQAQEDVRAGAVASVPRGLDLAGHSATM